MKYNSLLSFAILAGFLSLLPLAAQTSYGRISGAVTDSSGAPVSGAAVSGELSRIIDSKQIENLALNGRNYLQSITLVPEAIVDAP